MNKKLPLLMLLLLSTLSFAQNISFTFVNARNTNDGTDDFYEADIYIASDVDFKLGSGQIYFTYNTAAFGANIHTSGNFQYLQPSGSILGEVYGFPAYKDFIVNDNTTSRVSTSFQQGVSSGTITANNVISTPKHLFSVKIKYVDINEDPTVAFEEGSVFLDQFFTACGPAAFGFPDCTNHPGVQLLGDSFDSTGAVILDGVSWTGATDSDWSVIGNWGSGSLPTASDNVIIPNVANSPEIGTGISTQINNLTINSSSSLVVSGNGGIQVDGTFDNSGSVRITSSASSSGSMIVKGSSNGEVTYERGGLLANKWSIISAPVSGQSIKDFVENSANDIRVNNSTTPYRYAVSYYDDSRPSGTKWVYYDVDYLAANPNEAFEKGRSYAISRATDGVVSFTGTLEIVDATKPVIASEWNAVGNPYTAFLPINENSGTNFINNNLSNLDPMYVGAYVWDNGQNKYVAKTLVSGESSLAPGQGFFIKAATGVNSISFKEAQRMTQPVTGGVFNKGNVSLVTELDLLLTSKRQKVTTTISYRDNVTEGLDPGYDVGNFDGASLDIFTRLIDNSSDKNFTYQSLPNTKSNSKIIPIGVKAKEGLTITISLDNKSLSEGMDVYLEDKELKRFINLKNGDHTITLTNALNGAGRFYLHSKKVEESIAEVLLDDIIIYNSNNKLFVQGVLGKDFTITMFNILGSKVYNANYVGEDKNVIDLPKVSTGIYLVKLKTDIGEKTRKIVIKK